MTFQISYTDPLCDLSKDWNIIIIIRDTLGKVYGNILCSRLKM